MILYFRELSDSLREPLREHIEIDCLCLCSASSSCSTISGSEHFVKQVKLWVCWQLSPLVSPPPR